MKFPLQFKRINLQQDDLLRTQQALLLEQISSDVLGTLSLDELLQKSIDNIVSKCHYLGGILFLIQDDHIYAKTIAGGKSAGKFLELIGHPLSDLKITLDTTHNNFVVNSVIHKEPRFSNNIRDFTKGVLNNSIVNIAQAITNTQSCIAIPIIYQKQPIGALFFSKATADDFGNEKNLLHLLANYLGIAITNARSYSKVEQLNQRLLDSNKNLKIALDTVKELRRQEKDMIDVLGHELKTPITSLWGILQLMEKNHKEKGQIEKEKFEKYIDLAMESARKEIDLIETLLSATKIDSNKIQLYSNELNFSEIVSKSFDMYKKEAMSKGLIFKLEKTKDDILLFTDKVRLQEIVDNLISNAIKYTPNGSVHIKLSIQGKNAIFTIKDTGIGISEEDLNNLGKKFFRAKTVANPEYSSVVNVPGTGLGLFLVNGLLKEMGSKLEIESTLGEGSRFRFGLPIHR